MSERHERDERERAEHSWRPAIFDVSKPEEQAALEMLRAQGRIWHVHDTLQHQAHDLLDTRNPDIHSPMSGAPATTSGPDPAESTDPSYGRWVYYPWSGRLVRLLPPEDFRALRLSRNFYKITPEEQARLGQLTIGVAGLSAGAAVALTLALEGVGGHLKLADFDTLALSNMNRLRASVHDIGLPKTVLVARQIMEIDPYLTLTLYDEGVTPGNIDAFLGGSAPVDVVVDECDSLGIKLLLRERARALRLPVVMETSDRGMLDVERFDLEPDRLILHGRLGHLDSRSLAQLSAEARMGVAAQIVGPETLSTRLAASAMEIGHTIVSWPQLGSDVTLGGASVTAAVRRIGLEQPLPSGRRYVDLDAVLAREHEAITAVALPSPRPRAARTAGRSGQSSAQGCTELARFVVEHAAMAPSGGNAQPWRFHAEGDTLWMVLDHERADNLFSVGHRPTYLGLGAAAENLSIAAAHRGYAVEMEPFPRPSGSQVVAAFRLWPAHGAARAELAELATLIEPLRQRATNRKPGSGQPLTGDEQERLYQAGACHEAWVELTQSAQAVARVAALVGECERIRYLCGPLHREMFGELRWSARQAQEQRDGIDVATLEIDPAELARLRVAARPDVSQFLRDRNGGTALRRGPTSALVASASAVGVISMAGDTPEHWLTAGRAMQRVWIEATHLGLGFQPVGTLLYMMHMLDSPVGRVFRTHERASLLAQRQRMDELFPHSSRRVPVMMFRLVRAPMPVVRSLRRPVDEILVTGAPPELDEPTPAAFHLSPVSMATVS